MAISETALADGRRRMDELFPTRLSHMMFQLEHFANTLQQFDVTFYPREPILDVHLDESFAREFLARLTYCGLSIGHARRVIDLLRCVIFSDGTTTDVNDIWTINYMPHAGITIAELDSVDMTMAETKAGFGGETVRQMIRETYRCASAAEEDWFVRRWIAS